MLQSDQAIYDHGRIIWLTDKPSVEAANVIVTLLPTIVAPVLKPKRQPSTRIAGQGEILGDIIAPAASIENWTGLA